MFSAPHADEVRGDVECVRQARDGRAVEFFGQGVLGRRDQQQCGERVGPPLRPRIQRVEARPHVAVVSVPELVRQDAPAGDAIEAMAEDDLPPFRHSQPVRPVVVERYLVDAQSHVSGQLVGDIDQIGLLRRRVGLGRLAVGVGLPSAVFGG